MNNQEVQKIFMRLHQKSWLVWLVLFLQVFSGCASYHPVSLPKYQWSDYQTIAEVDGFKIGASAFQLAEIDQYFATPLYKKNIWPVRVMVLNESNRTVLFSKGMIVAAPVSPNIVARKGKRSVGHRLFWGWLLTATFFGAPIGIPLLVGGFQAMSANSKMEFDFSGKQIQDGMLEPKDELKGILFFEQPNAPDTFTVTFLDSQTDEKISIPVTINQAAGK